MPHALTEFVQFLTKSPTAFHACREISNKLLEADFTELEEKKKWHLEPEKGYFITRGDSLLAAFRTPKKKPEKALLHSSHLDSPALKIKPHPIFTSHGIGQLTTEVYGSPLLHTWLDRDLMIAGKIIILNQNGKKEDLFVTLDDYLINIPGIAIHLERSIMEKGVNVHKQDHLKPIFSLNGEGKKLEDWIEKHHSFQKILGFDLFLVPAQKPSFLGLENEFLSAYRIDNLSSAYASLYALLMAKSSSDTLQMSLFWDHEEIGSKTFTGADSNFSEEFLERISLALHFNREEFFCLKSSSLNLSIDVAHGFHPNFADKYDPQNAPFVGKGPVLKFNANQKYASNAQTALFLLELAEKEKIPLQKYAGRSDLSSGSTVGSMMAANMGIATLDLGIASWAMHSARETIGTQDFLSLCKLLKRSFEVPF